MKLRTFRHLALFLLVIPGTLTANNPFEKKCEKKGCSACEGQTGGTCSPDGNTYTTIYKFETQEEADGFQCPVEEVNSNEPTSSGAAGVTTDNYKLSSLSFLGVSPDYVKSEMVGGIRFPRQLPLKGATRFYSEVTNGYKATHYQSSQLNAPDANGLRTLKPNAEPSSISIYRNPDGDATTTQGRLDVVHQQRHPQTGEWVTRTIRKSAPQGNNNWSTKFYLGDPVQNPTLDPYREITITRTVNPDGTETTREVTKDRDSSGTYVITSDLTRTYAFYKHGEPAILSETKHTGTGSEPTTTWTYFHNSADQGSFNKPATMRRSDGQWSNTTYQGNPVTGTLVTKTVSGWLDNAAPAIGSAPDENANRVVTEFEAKNETGTIGREEKIQGVTVSKTWGERYKANSGELIEKSQVETGSATLTTIRTGYPDNDSVTAAERGRLKSIQHPDGTVTLYRHTMQGENRVETIDTGVGSLSAVTDGTRTVSTYTKDDVLIAQVTSDIASGIELSARHAIAFDANDRPTRWAHDNNPDDFSETINGCCGIDSERGRDGITTTYTRDGLKRPKTATSQGITLTYTYGRKTIGGTEFPSVNITATAGNLTLNKGTTVYDHVGNVIQQISPDLDGDGNEETTATTRDFTARTTTTTNPDGGTEIQTDFADGQSKSTIGTATAPAFYQYTTHAQQGGGLVTSTAPAATGPWTRTYQNLAGRSLKTTFEGAAGEMVLQTNSYDNLGRLVSSADADGVTSLLAYNAKGEAFRRAIDLNQNGQIDSADRVSDTLRDVVANSPIGAAIRSRSIIYDPANNPVTASTTLQSPDGLTTRTTTLGVANPSTSVSASRTDRADGAWTDTSTAPDGTSNRTTYQNWLATTQAGLDTAGNTIQSTTTGYDALHRPETRADSRTASSVVTRTAYYATNGLVASVTDDLTTGADRVTAFAYDSMGRRTATTLPDNSVTRTSYWPTSREKAAWGSQTNPTVKLYSPQGQLTELRTFRSANLALAPDESTGGYDATTWHYNARNQLERKEYADGKGTGYTYTNGGRLHTRTLARTVSGAPLVTTYGYSTAGELTTTDYSDTTPDVTIVLDKLGRQQSVTNGLATSVFTYDPATLALDHENLSYDLNRDGTADFTRVLVRSRDTLGRDTGWQLKEGQTVENEVAYGYHATLGRLQTVNGGSAGSFTYGYELGSSLLATVTGPAHTVTNTWDATRDVLDLKQNQVGTTTVSSYDYTVNVIGQRTNVAQTGTAFQAVRGIAWGYDSLGQVISADSSENTSDRAYQFDAIGNRVEVRDGVTAVTGTPNYTANPLNQYTAVGSLSPLNDDDGNATSYPLPADPGNLSTLAWDAENRLASATVSGTTSTYLYDAQSRRIAKTTGGVSTLFVYDAFNCIAEYSGTALAKTYLWGLDLSGSLQGAGGVGGLLAVKQGSAVHYPAFDGNGYISEYLASNGTVAAHFEYDPFGNTVVNTDSSGQFEYRFSTKPINFETGLYYYQYRYYDPVTGRWPSRDPIEESGGVNLYAFVGNDSVENFDIFGQKSCAAFQAEYDEQIAALCPARKISVKLNTLMAKAMIDFINGKSSCEKFRWAREKIQEMKKDILDDDANDRVTSESILIEKAAKRCGCVLVDKCDLSSESKESEAAERELKAALGGRTLPSIERERCGNPKHKK